MAKPTQEQTRQFMQRIPTHLHRLDYDAIRIDCNHHFSSLPVPVVDFDNSPFFFHQHHGGGFNLVYRARLIDNPQNLPYPMLN